MTIQIELRTLKTLERKLKKETDRAYDLEHKIDSLSTQNEELDSDISALESEKAAIGKDLEAAIHEICQLDVRYEKSKCCPNCKHYDREEYQFLNSFTEDCKVHGDPLVGRCPAWGLKE